MGTGGTQPLQRGRTGAIRQGTAYARNGPEALGSAIASLRHLLLPGTGYPQSSGHLAPQGWGSFRENLLRHGFYRHCLNPLHNFKEVKDGYSDWALKCSITSRLTSLIRSNIGDVGAFTTLDHALSGYTYCA